MRLLYYYLLFSHGLLCHRAAAQLPETYWIIPDGKGGDFTNSFVVGDLMNIAWEGWNSSYIGYFLHNNNITDLWVTTFALQNPLWTKFLMPGYDVREPGAYQWKIDIPDDILSQTPEYTLRFLPPGETVTAPDDPAPEMPSFGFIVHAAPVKPSPASSKSSQTSNPPTSTGPSSTPSASSSTVSSGSSAASSVSSGSSAASSVSSTASAQSTATSAPSSQTSGASAASTSSGQSSGPTDTSNLPIVDTSKATSGSTLSQGAKIGIGIGCAFAALVGIALLIFAVRYKRTPPQAQYQDLQDLKPISAPRELHGQTTPTELQDPYQPAYRAELPGH